MLLETLSCASERSAPILAEVLGYGMAMDLDGFEGQCLGRDGLVHAVQTALQRSDVDISEIDLVVWAPQGNIQDMKVLSVLELLMGDRYSSVPMVTSTFNTGYIETSSILISLGMALKAGLDLWPQKTGLTQIDKLTLSRPPGYTLALGSSDVGYNFAVVLSSGEGVERK